MSTTSIHWFRNGLRLHDNPPLLSAFTSNTSLPLFIIDPSHPFAQTPNRQPNAIRANFILQSLSELHTQLSQRKSRLFVILGKPEEVLPEVVCLVKADRLVYEKESAAPIREMDGRVLDAVRHRLKKGGNVQDLRIEPFETHNLHPMEYYVAKCPNGVAPSTYGAFCKIFQKLGAVPEEVATIKDIPPLPDTMDLLVKKFGEGGVPTLETLGYDDDTVVKHKEIFRGGEEEGLKRLKTMMARKKWVAQFEKPKTSPNALEPDTTGLSPYVKHGCLSPRKFYHALEDVYASYPSKHSLPPVSLHGQLLWREYNYLMGYTTPNFDKMVDNPIARQIPWDDDPQLLEQWKMGQTGYPFIDAIMTQLRETGWIHHLARHAVACFLTRGDLWQSWEKGAEVFEEYLIDADWSINNFNWQWLSCTAHFYQYFRCYSPISFGKKTDKDGNYIRKWLPQFQNFPSKYIYEPWTAPIAVQRNAGVLVGVDYPTPVVDHKIVSKSNMGRMKEAYDRHKEMEEERRQRENVVAGEERRRSQRSDSGSKRRKVTRN